jgi:hypothetical protein
MEAKYPGQFRFELARDAGTTGRLEVTIYLNSKERQDKSGVVVHSKKGGQGYAHNDWAGFEKRWEDAMAAATK